MFRDHPHTESSFAVLATGVVLIAALFLLSFDPAIRAVVATLGGSSAEETAPVVLGPATMAVRGTVVAAQDDLLRLRVGNRELLVRPPSGAVAAIGAQVEAAGPASVAEVFQAERFHVLAP